MVELIPSDIVENAIGVERHEFLHYAIAVLSDEKLMILHSRECRDRGTDYMMRTCLFSQALHSGLCEGAWAGHMDVPVVALLFNQDGRTYLGPATTTEDWFNDPTLKVSDRIREIEQRSRRG